MSEQDEPSRPRPQRPGASRFRMIRVGALSCLGSVAVLALPAVAPLGNLAKYVAVPGLIGICFGAGCVLNGLIDLASRGD